MSHKGFPNLRAKGTIVEFRQLLEFLEELVRNPNM
jgi:hypothetical protein